MEKKHNFWREISYIYHATIRNKERAHKLYEIEKKKGILLIEPIYQVEKLLKEVQDILDAYRRNRAKLVFGKHGVLESIIDKKHKDDGNIQE